MNKLANKIAVGTGASKGIGADIAVEAEVQKLFQAVKELFGRVDLLVNHAGIYSFAPLDAITPADFHSMFDTNVLGTLLTPAPRVPST